MKYWIVVLILWMIVFAVVAAPAPSVDENKFVTIPVIQSADSRLWEARLQCDVRMQNCIVVYAKEICQIGITHFSPSFCYEFNR